MACGDRSATADSAARTQLALTISYVILFDPGSAELTLAGQVGARDLARAAMQQQNLEHAIIIVGHSDTAGNPLDNLVLSCRRAAALRDYLLAAGVAAERLIIQGRGESDLAVPTGDGIRNQANRRVVPTFASGPETGDWAARTSPFTERGVWSWCEDQ